MRFDAIDEHGYYLAFKKMPCGHRFGCAVPSPHDHEFNIICGSCGCVYDKAILERYIRNSAEPSSVKCPKCYSYFARPRRKITIGGRVPAICKACKHEFDVSPWFKRYSDP